MSKDDEFDRFIQQLQDEIDEKDKEDFSDYALELGHNPYHYGSIQSSQNVYSEAWCGPCGDEMKIYLKIENGIIINASFEVDGCVTSIIAGSQMIKMIEHKSVTDAENITDTDVLKALGKFPAESSHCCTLAVTTLRKTIDFYKSESIN